MPESSLALSYEDIRKDVADQRGYRRVADDWGDYEKEILDVILRDGSAMFYGAYDWNFLVVPGSVTLATGTSEVDLPWDFGFPVDACVYFQDNIGRPMELTNDGVVFLRRQNHSGQTGKPSVGAIVTEGKPGVKLGQASKLIFWPEADDDYAVEFRYSVLGDALKAVTPMPYGGAIHARAIRLACLAASERRDGQPQGPHNLEYMEALEQSKVHDRRIKPRVINGKKRYPDSRGMFRESNVVTYIPGP